MNAEDTDVNVVYNLPQHAGTDECGAGACVLRSSFNLKRVEDTLETVMKFMLHTHQLVASTWLGDHQGRPSAPTISLD